MVAEEAVRLDEDMVKVVVAKNLAEVMVEGKGEVVQSDLGVAQGLV